MDITSYPEFKETIQYDKDEESNDYNKYVVTCIEDFYKLVLVHKGLKKDKFEYENSDEYGIKEVEKEESKNNNTYYRGQANTGWDIMCSLFRYKLAQKENQLIQEILNRRPFDFINCKTNLDKLILMQHYGIPTRLLDITINPLVALYFACEDKKEIEENGAVYIFEENHDEYFELNSKEIVASLAFLKDKGTLADFQSILEKDRVIFEKSNIEAILNKKYSLIIPKLNNDRIISQQGFFLCCSNESTVGLLEHDSEIKKITFPIEAARKIIISGKHKKNILEELEFLGIKRSILFPELENHADELIEKFSIKNISSKPIDKNNPSENTAVSESEENIIAKKNEDLISLIKNSISDSQLKENLLSNINKDLHMFDYKKSRLKSIIKRSQIENKIKINLISLIEE